MSKYNDIQYLVDRPKPTKIFLEARNMAGMQLQQQKNRLLEACEKNNLIPCFFRFRFLEKKSLFFDVFKKSNNEKDYDLKPFNEGWNLYDARTNEKIDPFVLATNEPVKMSEWELNNFAIQIVRNDLENEGNEILSFCDLVEVNPQIWFKNKKGEVGWVIVKHITNEKDLDYREWVGLEKNNPQLQNCDGYFAPIQFASFDSPTLLRGGGVTVNYRGLKRIYVS